MRALAAWDGLALALAPGDVVGELARALDAAGGGEICA